MTSGVDPGVVSDAIKCSDVSPAAAPWPAQRTTSELPRGSPCGVRTSRRKVRATVPLDAGVLGEELVGRWQAPGEVRQIHGERPEALADAVHQLLQGVERAAMRRPHRDQLAGDRRAALLVEIPAGDEATHRMTDEDDLGVAELAALPTPLSSAGSTIPLSRFPLNWFDNRQS